MSLLPRSSEPSSDTDCDPAVAVAVHQQSLDDRIRFSPCRILSVQSHVVSGDVFRLASHTSLALMSVTGCVGNRAAVFPLQTLGFNADFINTVQFSNHTGYPVFKGSHASREQLQLLVDGLEANGENILSVVAWTGFWSGR
jgi:pyridoxal/pyridoxine/pyridoxamine kinase